MSSRIASPPLRDAIMLQCLKKVVNLVCYTSLRPLAGTVSCADLMMTGGRPMADSNPSSSLRFPEWQKEYEAALLQTDDGKLPQSIAASETADPRQTASFGW